MDTQVADPLLGSLVDGRYRVHSRVARGGMATVYTAVDERLERTIALKIIHSGRDHLAAPGQRMSLERFTDEAKTIARLTHPNVVAVYDTGLHLGSPYLVMEYVRGRTLREFLTERRRLSPLEALAVLEQMLAAIAAAHRAGLVHRDVKPENVLIAEAPGGGGQLIDAVVKVADFGLARAVEASADDLAGGQLMATVAYVAPELVTDGYADPRTDVYAAGIVLFEMLTGRVPYEGDRPVDVAWQHVDRDVPPPSRLVPGLPPVLDHLVARATRRDPSARPTDAGALLAEVQMVREDLGAAALRARPAAQPTVAVDQVSPADRPAWARLPQGGTVFGGRRHQVEVDPDATMIERAKFAYQRMQADPRGRKVLTAALVVMSLLVLTAGWWFIFGRYEAAPQLAGKTRAQAEQMLAEAGFTVKYGEGQYREDIPKDIVLAQNPPAGDRAVRGSAITLTLSLGPERYLVPDVVGETWDAAQTDIKAVKLVPVKGVAQYSDTFAKDTVISTSPAALDKDGNPVELKAGEKVTVVLSKGRAPITVPNVIGQYRDVAAGTLQGLGLVVNFVEEQSDQPGGQVLRQDPVAGSGAAPGQTITLTVSAGPPGIVMPRVIDMNCQQATSQLQSMGLQVDLAANDFEKAFGTVREQRPNEGRMLKQGDRVWLRCKVG